MRVIVIGGSGHIGTYLTPRLVEAGHMVVCVSRSIREPYRPDPAWNSVELVKLERGGDGFGAAIVALRPDAVIDLISYTLESTRELVEAIDGRVGHFLHCGTVWVHGPGTGAPMTEDTPRQPISDYGRRKAAIEEYLLTRAGFPAAILHPGHLVGIGWLPLNPAANFDPRVFDDLAHGREIALPNSGRETLHHVHADDVAQAFVKAITYWPNAVGNSFHVCSPEAIGMADYAESVAGWHGREARVRFLPWEQWREGVTEKDAAVTWDHIARTTASRRLAGCWTISRGMDRWRRFTNRCSRQSRNLWGRIASCGRFLTGPPRFLLVLPTSGLQTRCRLQTCPTRRFLGYALAFGRTPRFRRLEDSPRWACSLRTSRNCPNTGRPENVPAFPWRNRPPRSRRRRPCGCRGTGDR
jgi:nucleoside-diphosphate-sugar epimerase